MAAIRRALTAVFSEDCNASTAARSDELGGGSLLAPFRLCVCETLPLAMGDSSDANDGMDADSDLSPDSVRLDFSGVPCFKKVWKNETDELE
jgi:hypothetical protein